MVPRAVLFDFDGVIADTENHHITAWQRTLLGLGWQVPEEIAVRAAEIDDREFLRGLFASQQVDDGDIEGWVRKKQALTIMLIRDAPRIYPGVIELIEALRGRVRLGIVSGTNRENIEAVLSTTTFAESFDVIIGKEDVSVVKPDPEAYILALERLRLTAADTVALEDSPSGLASASTAGLSCVAVGHRRGFGEWVGGHVYVSGLEPVDGLLRHLELLGTGG
jgi:beta-phosphoglucomutase